MVAKTATHRKGVMEMKCKNCSGNGRVTIGWDSYPCDFCHGTGEIEQTNFENITKDVDTLAQWLSKEIRCCNFIPCNECIANISEEECNEDLTNFDLWKAWLIRPCHKEK